MAADMLNPGDIILIEAQAPGPRFIFQQRDDRLGYIALQYWRAEMEAITYATVIRGVIVVEAAGNGTENLDDSIYSTSAFGLPLWAPFDRTKIDNGAIIVGAGAPPPGTHGNDHGPDRSRLEFSNFGACVDAQGWGQEVTTCGYGDTLQGGVDEDLWYTQTFNGTSSASPIVVGVLACIQGILKAHGKPLLTPISARNFLRGFGMFQQDALGRPATQRIGNRPDIIEILERMGGL
jgi:subtilisin family serine protease